MDMSYHFQGTVVEGVLLRRYKRFFVDALLSGEAPIEIVAHTPNTGSMMGLIEPGRKVLLTHNPSPTRKLAYTLQAIEVDGSWVGCNTHLPNALIESAILGAQIPELVGYASCQREVKYGEDGKSRIDLLLSNHAENLPSVYVEVKNVTLKLGNDACFPDAVTERGLKHLHELVREVRLGNRSVMLFLTQRTDCTAFRAAHEIDPAYADQLQKAQKEGVEMLCLMAQVTRTGVSLVGRLPIQC